jgi:prophage regulatory protein
MSEDRHFLVDWAGLGPQVPYCRQHITRLEHAEQFPARVQVGERRVAWWQDEIDRWLSSRARGIPKQGEQLGPKPHARPLPLDPADIELLHELAAKLGVEIATPARRRGRPPKRHPELGGGAPP